MRCHDCTGITHCNFPECLTDGEVHPRVPTVGMEDPPPPPWTLRQWCVGAIIMLVMIIGASIVGRILAHVSLAAPA